METVYTELSLFTKFGYQSNYKIEVNNFDEKNGKEQLTGIDLYGKNALNFITLQLGIQYTVGKRKLKLTGQISHQIIIDISDNRNNLNYQSNYFDRFLNQKFKCSINVSYQFNSNSIIGKNL